MGKIRQVFTEQEIKVLKSNPSVLRVSEKNITYCPAFKIAAVQANQAGHAPTEIFVQAGFSVELIGQETTKNVWGVGGKHIPLQVKLDCWKKVGGRETEEDRSALSYRLRKSSVFPWHVSSF